MSLRPRSAALPCLALALALGLAGHAQAAERPRVRAITAFVSLKPAGYQKQIADALAFLRAAKAAFEKAGYTVETLRITTQPFPEYIRGMSEEQALGFFRDYDALARKDGFDAAIGPALASDQDDPRLAQVLGWILAGTTVLEGSIVVGGADGVHWKSVRAAAELVKFLSEHTERSQGNFRFAATALVPSGTPFYPASYYAGAGREFALGLESANVVAEAFASAPNFEAARNSLEFMLGGWAGAIQAIARQVEKQTGWSYLGLDDSPAPLKEVSIGGAIEKLIHAPVGSSGTLAAAALVTGVLKNIPIQHAGYSGLMLPVLEDSVLAERWSEGRLRLDSLLAYSAVCGTGLDVVPLPGDVTVKQLARIIGDVASLAVKLHKPLSARLLPVAGKKPGERTEFQDPFLVNAILQPLP
jgi:uncharacterized protein (UPF0210 family)